MTSGDREAVIVTSGLGPGFGGVGTASHLIARSLPGKVAVWRHHHLWPAAARRPALVLRASLGALRRPRLVIYEHVHLSAIHGVVPGLSRTPCAVFLHGTETWRPLGDRIRRALSAANVLLANSETTVRMAREANGWLPDARITHLGVALPARAPPPLAEREPLALMVGRMAGVERYKGHDEVLDAWPAIRRAVPGAELVVAGGGDDLPRLRLRAAALQGVRFAGYVSDAELDTLYRKSRLLLFPSLREGFGLVALEAAARGTPVLGLSGTVLEELFPRGGVALAPSQDPATLAEAAAPILADPATAQPIADAGRAQVEANFLEQHFAARLRAALGEWLV